jgi:hypothetical protein
MLSLAIERRWLGSIEQLLGAKDGPMRDLRLKAGARQVHPAFGSSRVP